MKPKQLANVLIKTLGLAVCLYAIPGVVQVIVVALSMPAVHAGFAPWFSYSIGYIVQIAAALFVIIQSEMIVGKFFKDQDE